MVNIDFKLFAIHVSIVLFAIAIAFDRWNFYKKIKSLQIDFAILTRYVVSKRLLDGLGICIDAVKDKEAGDLDDLESRFKLAVEKSLKVLDDALKEILD